MAYTARALAELSLPPILAKEVATQLNTGVPKVSRLVELSMVPALAKELASQILTTKNANRLAALGMPTALAWYIASGTGPPPVITTLSPSPLWNGTAGSGYAGSPPVQTGTAQTTYLVNPEYGFMETEAPVGAFISPAYQCMSMEGGNFRLLLEGYAADSAGGIDGIDYVRVHCEGNYVDVSAPSINMHPDFEGTPIPTLTYAVDLDYAAFSGNGAINIYAEFVPKDTANLVRRIIGPMRIVRQATWDRVIDIAPSQPVVAGSRYQSVPAALTYAATLGNEQIRLRCVEDVEINPDVVNFGSYSAATAPKFQRVVIDGNGFNVVGKCTTFRLFRPNYNNLVFEGVKIDVGNMVGFFGEQGIAGWRGIIVGPGCDIYSSYGATDLVGGTGGQPGGIGSLYPRTANALDYKIILYRCKMHDYMNALGGTLRGQMTFCRAYNSYVDFASLIPGRTAVIAYNWVNDYTADLNNPIPAMTLTNTGGGVLEYAYVGTAGTATRGIQLFRDGVSIGSFLAQVAALADARYTVAGLAAAITAGGIGVTAAVIGTPPYRAASLGPEAAALATKYPAATNPYVNLYPHVDCAQLNHQSLAGTTNVPHDNILVSHNYFLDVKAQTIFLGLYAMTTGVVAARNMAYICNAAVQKNDPLNTIVGLASQVGGTCQHLMIAHNSLPNQSMWLRFDQIAPANNETNLNTRCRVLNNIFWLISEINSTLAASRNFATIRNNNSYGANLLTSGTLSNNTMAGTATDDFPALAIGGPTVEKVDVIPSIGGPARSNPKQPSVAYSLNGVSFGSSGPTGACV